MLLVIQIGPLDGPQAKRTNAVFKSNIDVCFAWGARLTKPCRHWESVSETMSTLRSELSVLSVCGQGSGKCPLGTDEGAENAAL